MITSIGHGEIGQGVPESEQPARLADLPWGQGFHGHQRVWEYFYRFLLQLLSPISRAFTQKTGLTIT